MAPSKDNSHNSLIAEGVFSLYASTIPAFLTPVVRAVLIAFMDSRLISAFKLSTSRSIIAPSHIQSFLCFLLTIRKQIVKHLMLLRYWTLQVFGEENATGYRHMVFWKIQPWFVSTSRTFNWVYSAYTRLFQLPVAGDAKFRPEGYKLRKSAQRILRERVAKRLCLSSRKIRVALSLHSASFETQFIQQVDAR